MHCEKCHASRCLRHHLLDGIHAAEAVLLLSRDPQAFHVRHNTTNRDEYLAGQDGLRAADKQGSVVPAFKDKLCSLALQYKTCRPINYMYTNPGWYDDDGLDHVDHVSLILVSSFNKSTNGLM